MLPEPIPGLSPGDGALRDRYGRRHTYLRVSVTDRCNYRCTYCMPAEGLDWIPKDRLLSADEIVRLVGIFAGMGIERIRLTGGEPTVRKDIEPLVTRIAKIPGISDLALTTNGHRFAPMASRLAAAGLRRVNISLDSLDPERFRRVTRGGDLARVLGSVDAALEAGLLPVKINAVVIGGENDGEVGAFVERFSPLAGKVEIRFIEYMPFSGNDPVWRHLPARILRERLSERYALDPVPSGSAGPAKNWKIRETGLVVGFISPLTEHFCESCNRLRLQADGHLRTCLSREADRSLRDLLREGASDDEIRATIRSRLWGKVAGHEAHLGSRAFEGVMTSVGG